MAKFLPVIGEIFTTVESAAKLVGAAVVAPFDSEKAKQLLKGAGDAWVDYTDNNAIALAVQGRGKDLGGKSVGFAEGLPVVGHGIGVGRYIAGDREGGDRCMKQASRSTAVVAATLLTGGAGALACGAAAVGAGLVTDAVTTGVDSAVHGEYRPAGVVAGVTEAIETGDPNKVIDVGLIPVADFASGAIAGRNPAAVAAEAELGINAARPRISALPAVGVADAPVIVMRPRANSAPVAIGRVVRKAAAGPSRLAAVLEKVPKDGRKSEKKKKEHPRKRTEDATHGEELSEYGIANPKFIATWEPQNQILTLYMEEERLRQFEKAMEGCPDAKITQLGSLPKVHLKIHTYRGETPQNADLHTHVKIYAEQEATIRQVLGLVLGEGNVEINNFIDALLKF